MHFKEVMLQEKHHMGLPFKIEREKERERQIREVFRNEQD
jgi:hypothetical protein